MPSPSMLPYTTGFVGAWIDRDAVRGEKRPMVDSPFDTLEKRISDLAGMVIALKKEKAALASRLEEKESEVRNLTQTIADLTGEREEIRNRVESILTRIESIEF